jgi:uncharacterized protein (TIGR02996 family)
MPDAEAFLRAIIENPDDDSPRLIYADWLDENGDPDRAEFIRVQIALARNGSQTRADLPLIVRENVLQKRHLREWHALMPHARFSCQRGFVHEVRASTFEFVEMAEQIYRRAPVEHLHLHASDAPPHEHARLMQRFAGIAGLTCVRSLSLASNHIGSDGLQALAVCPHLTRLGALNLRGNSIGERGVRALVDAPWFASLTILDLSDNDVNAAAAHALGVALDALKADGRLRLWQLVLGGNPLRTAGSRVIRGSPALQRVARL